MPSLFLWKLFYGNWRKLEDNVRTFHGVLQLFRHGKLGKDTGGVTREMWRIFGEDLMTSIVMVSGLR